MTFRTIDLVLAGVFLDVFFWWLPIIFLHSTLCSASPEIAEYSQFFLYLAHFLLMLPAFPRPPSVPANPLPRPEEGAPNQNFLNSQICKKMQIGFLPKWE